MYSNIDKSQKHVKSEKKTGTRGFILYHSTYMTKNSPSAPEVVFM